MHICVTWLNPVLYIAYFLCLSIAGSVKWVYASYIQLSVPLSQAMAAVRDILLFNVVVYMLIVDEISWAKNQGYSWFD